MPPRKASKVLLLETSMDERMTSQRSQIRFMREFFTNFPPTDFVPREVHSKADLNKFLNYARKNKFEAVHVVAHGKITTKSANLILTHGEKLDLRSPTTRKMFRDLKAEVLFFSSCELGRDPELMRKLVRESGAWAIFSYSDFVTDYQAFIIESLFYHLSYGYFEGRRSELTFREAYERLKFTLEMLGIDERRRTRLSKPLLVGEFWPE